jgi:hypothetical protein
MALSSASLTKSVRLYTGSAMVSLSIISTM